MAIHNTLAVFGLATAVALSSCGGKGKSDADAEKARQDSLAAVEQARLDSIAAANAPVNVVETAMKDERFTTLVELISAAGLVETLSDTTKNFTVFAPTNEAFAALDAAELEALKTDLKRRQDLTDILTYHVVSGRLSAGDLANYTELDALDEKVVQVKVAEGSTMVGGANVVEADIAATNGILHVVDAVMTPPAKKGKAKAPKVVDPTPNVNVEVDRSTNEGGTTRGGQPTGRTGDGSNNTAPTGRTGDGTNNTAPTSRGGN